MQSRLREPRHEAAHVGHRNQLVFAHGDRRHRNENAPRIDLVQVDRLGQALERARTVASGVIGAAR